MGQTNPGKYSWPPHNLLCTPSKIKANKQHNIIQIRYYTTALIKGLVLTTLNWHQWVLADGSTNITPLFFLQAYDIRCYGSGIRRRHLWHRRHGCAVLRPMLGFRTAYQRHDLFRCIIALCDCGIGWTYLFFCWMMTGKTGINF
jgi:hypothetical protein